ncbi:MAG: AAA family ATPase [Lewinellaceae bacterium]|nr:AAA family ATPase [Lewinellaceae bacterium]
MTYPGFTRQVIIVVTGLPGTGKTALAEMLARIRGCCHLNTDVIRVTLGKQGQYDAATKALVYAALLQEARQHLSAGKDVLLDGTFFRQELREPIHTLGLEFSARTLWIELVANEEVIRKRVAVQRPYSEADFSVYEALRDQYEPLVYPRLILRNEQHSLAELAGVAQAYISSQLLTPFYPISQLPETLPAL